MSRRNRRQFLQQAAVAGAGFAGFTFAIAGTKSTPRVLGANDRIRVAVAGLHGRGSSHVNAFLGMAGVEVAYLVDPDVRQFAPKVKQVRQKGGYEPKTVQDIRQVLDDPSVDVVSIATPNHWHSLMTVWACQAGKDVYVEKPCSHNVWEGRQAVEAARRYRRIVQHGTQSRSERRWWQTIAHLHSGKYGKLLVAKAYCYKRRRSIGFRKPEPVPDWLDFNLWLGPAPQQPFHRNLVHYNWHWFWDTGNGDIGNQGVHQMDIARWGIPGATLPRQVVSFGGRLGYRDQGQTPNTQVAIMDYDDGVRLVFEVRGLKSPRKITNEFYTTEGMITAGRFLPKGAKKAEPLPPIDVSLGPGGGNHFANFIEAVRSRNVQDLNADIEQGHLSSALCHLANISYRLGERVPFVPRTKAFGQDKLAYEELMSMEEHLAGENGLKLQAETYTLGARLQVDAQRETITNRSDAAELLTRRYRKPFVVPERV